MTKYMWFFFGSIAGAVQMFVIHGTTKLFFVSSIAFSLLVYYFILLGTAAIEVLWLLNKAKKEGDK